MTEEEDKAIKDCDSIFIYLDDAMSEDSANYYRKSYKILKNLIEKQSKKIEQTKYIKRNFDYCIAVEKKKLEDKIKAKIDEIKEEKRHYLEINDEYNAQICDCIIEEYESLLEKE